MPPKQQRDAPQVRFTARSKEGLQFFVATEPGKFTVETTIPNVDEDVTLVYSNYGSVLAYREKEGGTVAVVNSDTAEIMHRIPTDKVMELALSPKGTYLVTWRHLDRREPDVPTLRVYSTKTGQEVAAFVQNKWPALHWTTSESNVLRVMGGGAYNIAGDFSGEILSQYDGRFTVFSLSPANEAMVAMLLPYKTEEKKPAFVRICSANKLDEDYMLQQLGKVDDADLMWNSNGSCLLVHAKTNVDETGRSYYGESLLILFQLKGKQHWHIQLGQNEPLHDVQWAPNGQEFIAVYGEMPSNKVTLFSCAGNPLHHFPIAARNRVIWAPNGRFILLAGFGNLAGDMEVWDRAKLGAASAASPTQPTTVGCIAKMTHKSVTQQSWSPDSRHILTAVTFPRMRLDNRIAVWKHNGVLEDRFEYPELYQINFRPMAPKVYGAREPSPPPSGHVPQNIGKAAAAVFRPSRGGSSAVAEAMKSHRATQASSGFAQRASSSAAFKDGIGGFRGATEERVAKQDYIPGLPPELQKAQLEAKRKAAEKAKAEGKTDPNAHWRDQPQVQQAKAPPKSGPKAGGKGGKK